MLLVLVHVCNHALLSFSLAQHALFHCVATDATTTVTTIRVQQRQVTLKQWQHLVVSTKVGVGSVQHCSGTSLLLHLAKAALTMLEHRLA
jgi:hypothetical protein